MIRAKGKEGPSVRGRMGGRMSAVGREGWWVEMDGWGVGAQ